MQKAAKLRSIATQFVVTDVVATAEFYRDKLGFTICGFWAEPPVYAIVQRGGVEMHFGKNDVNGTSNSEIRELAFDAYIWVDDVYALFEEFNKSGADILEGPVKRIYNSIEVTVRDCNGFILVFAQ